jgi:hypothetical protein
MPRYPWIEFPLLVIAILSPLLIVGLRLCIKRKETKTEPESKGVTTTTIERPMGIGVRMIQLIAVLMLVPTITVLALEGCLTGEGTGTLLGAIVGYALGGITAPVPKEK